MSETEISVLKDIRRILKKILIVLTIPHKSYDHDEFPEVPAKEK